MIDEILENAQKKQDKHERKLARKKLKALTEAQRILRKEKALDEWKKMQLYTDEEMKVNSKSVRFSEKIDEIKRKKRPLTAEE